MKENSLAGGILDSIGRSVDVGVGTVVGTKDATLDLATGKQDVGDVWRGASRQAGVISATAGHNLVDVALSGQAEEARDEYRQTAQFKRSQRNARRGGILGRSGAVAEVAVDFTLDNPRGSVQDRAARAVGGRENISRNYNTAARIVDQDILGAVGKSTKESWTTRTLSELFVTPAVKGVAAVTTGTDVETGEKKDATGEDIFETALLPVSVATGGAGGAILKGGGAAGKVATRGNRARKAARATKADAATPPARPTTATKAADEATPPTTKPPEPTPTTATKAPEPTAPKPPEPKPTPAPKRVQTAPKAADEAADGVAGTGQTASATAAGTAAAGGAVATMVNPINIIRGVVRGGDKAASSRRARRARRAKKANKRRSQRTVSSTDNLPVLKNTTRRLDNAPSGTTAPRRVEQTQQTRRSTGVDDIRKNEGGTGSPRLIGGPGQNLPTTVNQARRAGGAGTKTRQTTFAGGRADQFDFGKAIERATETQAARRGSQQAARQGARQADEAGGVLDRVRQVIPGIPTARRGARSADEVADLRRGAGAAQTTRRADRATDASQARRAGQSRRADDMARSRRAENARRSAQSRRADDMARARRAERATGAARTAGRAGRLGRLGARLGAVPVLGGVLRWTRRHPIASGAGGVVGGALVAEEIVDLTEPEEHIDGGPWYAERRKSYTVQIEGEPTTVYSYEVFAAETGDPLGYTVVLGMDSNGRVYYLGGSPQRPSEARSRVTTDGLGAATNRAAEAKAQNRRAREARERGRAAAGGRGGGN